MVGTISHKFYPGYRQKLFPVAVNLASPTLLGGDNSEQLHGCEVFGACSQLCTNREEAFSCSCIPGFTLHQNGWGCNPTDRSWWKLLYRESGTPDVVGVVTEIYRQWGGLKQIFEAHGGNIDGITYDARSNAIYWANVDASEAAIYRVNFNRGSSVDVIVDTGLVYPKDIAFDWITGNVYFVDYNYQRIGVCKNDSSTCAIIAEHVGRPKNIVLHPNLGIMFWIDCHNALAIVRAGMDGSFPQKIASWNSTCPNSIAIDYGSGRIYWGTGRPGQIESSRFDGTDIHVIISGVGKNATLGMDVFGDRIFWSNMNSNKIRSVNKIDGSDEIVHRFDMHFFAHKFSIFHVANQPITGPNPCDVARCSHICTIGPKRKFRCFCPTGMALTSDNKTCVKRDDVPKLFVGIHDTITSLIIGGIGKSMFEYISLRPQIKSIAAMVYNPVNHTLIISDTTTRRIFEYDLLSQQLRVVVEGSLGMVQSLDIDVVGENLYWADSDKNTIEVMSFRTRARTVVQRGIQNVTDILVVLSKQSWLIVSTFDGSTGNIYKMSLNGLKRTVITILEKQEPAVLSYDRKHGNILWVDNKYHYLESASLGALQSSAIRSDLRHPASDMVAVGSVVYYAARSSNRVHVFNLEENGALPCVIRFKNSPQNFSNGADVKMAIVDPQMSELEHLLKRHECATWNPNQTRCTHVCLLSETEFNGVCQCPEGLTLDEDGKTCTRYVSCTENHFTCKSGKCLPKTYVCNGRVDCDDNKDEEKCFMPSTFTKNNSNIDISTENIAPIKNFNNANFYAIITFYSIIFQFLSMLHCACDFLYFI